MPVVIVLLDSALYRAVHTEILSTSSSRQPKKAKATTMSTKSILAIFMAASTQGQSIITQVLNDPSLSSTYTIRAITRDPSSTSAQFLHTLPIEVVAADASNPSTLLPALKDVTTVFAVTMPNFSPTGLEDEYNAGVAIANAAVALGCKYLIFSTLPSVTSISSGKYGPIAHFDARARVEGYIRTLDIQSAFVSLGCFMENFVNPAFAIFWPKRKEQDGKWVITLQFAPDSVMPLVAAGEDTGKFVGAILADPCKFEGKTVCASGGLYTWRQVAAVMAKSSGKDVVYEQVSKEEWTESLMFGKEVFPECFAALEEFGYYGPKTVEEVGWAVENARGEVMGLGEFLVRNPLRLE